MKYISIITFLAIIFALPFTGRADIPASLGDNPPRVEASIAPTNIMIGDQPVLTIKVTKDVSQQIGLPEFKDKLTDNVEIIYQAKIDTIREENSRVMTLIRNYVITTFDAGDYRLDSFPIVHFINENRVDTIYSNAVNFKVNTYQIDTTTQVIYDIKAPIDAPLILSEIDEYIYLGLFILLLAAVLTYIIVKLRKKEALFAKPKIPPHILAVNELNKIRELALWQNGKHKEYYTMLTDTVREYLEGRFGVGAMEMTTEEIMAAIKDDPINQKEKDNLYELLSLADLVKFAKFVPSIDDNEQSFNRAFDFVDSTKGAEETIEEEATPAEESEKEESNNKEEKEGEI